MNATMNLSAFLERCGECRKKIITYTLHRRSNNFLSLKNKKHFEISLLHEQSRLYFRVFEYYVVTLKE